jgi:exodeoxyribonuclease-5/deoxyribonuclease V
MIVAVDTYYDKDKAKTVAVTFSGWKDDHFFDVFTEVINITAPYQPGEFYKRELPCIMSILYKIDLSDVEVIIIDGYVTLDDFAKPGLGAYLYASLNERIAVIGVAKTNYFSGNKMKREIYRGRSQRPLYITSAGMSVDTASELVASMHGPHRIPSLLKALDGLTRTRE